jgi:hypothetical protein
MSELGICPTCHKPVSTSVRRCPHCGEDDFLVIRGGEEQECPECHGASSIGTIAGLGKYQCSTCNYIGKVRIYEIVDRRTGVAKRVIRSVFQNWNGEMIYDPTA